jgi:hypothetical protein
VSFQVVPPLEERGVTLPYLTPASLRHSDDRHEAWWAFEAYAFGGVVNGAWRWGGLESILDDEQEFDGSFIPTDQQVYEAAENGTGRIRREGASTSRSVRPSLLFRYTLTPQYDPFKYIMISLVDQRD